VGQEGLGPVEVVQQLGRREHGPHALEGLRPRARCAGVRAPRVGTARHARCGPGRSRTRPRRGGGPSCACGSGGGPRPRCARSARG
jgi:hypothetical protein